MKTVGIIGGMSWESTSTYYRRLNQLVNERLGGLHSAELLLASVDFAPIEKCKVRANGTQPRRLLSVKPDNLNCGSRVYCYSDEYNA